MTTPEPQESLEPVPFGAGSFSVVEYGDIVETLLTSRSLGFLGPGPVEAHIDHALAHLAVVKRYYAGPRTLCDLGSGGGVPALVFAASLPESELTLVDSMAKRCEFLAGVVTHFAWEDSVSVWHTRAEEFARLNRERFDVVTARSFAQPAVTAEIAAGLVKVGGVVVVSATPDSRDLWNAEAMVELGYGPAEIVVESDRSFAVINKLRPCSSKFPRRTGIPSKRPLW